VYDLLIFHADDTEAVPPRSDNLENTVAAEMVMHGLALKIPCEVRTVADTLSNGHNFFFSSFQLELDFIKK